ncbi:MAG: hypothetical protein ACRDGG_08670, partial [Anaerolineae bacterium]
MSDRRSVDELSIEELEQILAIKKRQAREATLRRLKGEGRVVDVKSAGDATKRSTPNRGAPIEPAGARYRSFELDATPTTPRRVFGWRAW